MSVIEPFACVLLVCIWFAVNGSLRRYAVQHPVAQGAQMAYAAIGSRFKHATDGFTLSMARICPMVL